MEFGRKKKIKHKQALPRYEITMNKNNGDKLEYLALVTKPAIEENGYAFANQQRFEFKVYDKDQGSVIGAFMIPDKDIYRSDDAGEYNVYFSSDTIKQYAYDFMNNGGATKLNLEHDKSKLIGSNAFIAESWIVKDKIMDKGKAMGFDHTPGTWMGIVQFKDPQDPIFQDYVKNGMDGFSVEGIMSEMVPQFNIQPNDVTCLDEEEVEFIFSLSKKEFNAVKVLPPEIMKKMVQKYIIS